MATAELLAFDREISKVWKEAGIPLRGLAASKWAPQNQAGAAAGAPPNAAFCRTVDKVWEDAGIPVIARGCGLGASLCAPKSRADHAASGPVIGKACEEAGIPGSGLGASVWAPKARDDNGQAAEPRGGA